MHQNFFDTSALGKHYHHETGSAKVDQFLAEAGSRHLISCLTVVEIQSVFAKKVRSGVINLGCAIATAEEQATVNPEIP